MSDKNNIILEKSKAFAIRIVKMYKWLSNEQKEFILSKQCLRSGTSIGANINEGTMAASKADFINKLRISLKEANETKYWLELLHETDYLSDEMYDSIHPDCLELIKLLVSIIKTSKQNTSQNY